MTAILREKPRAVLWRQPGTSEGNPAPVVHYEGERIYFRPIGLADEPLLRRWVNDPANWRGLRFRGPVGEHAEREWIESLGKTAGNFVFAVVARDEDRLLGTVGLHGVDPISHSATLGICIGDRELQGNGYGTEAVRLILRYGFEELNLNRIQLSVLSDNFRAILAYQKAGFVHEGCLRNAQYRNGRYQDEYLFAMLREEWEREVK